VAVALKRAGKKDEALQAVEALLSNEARHPALDYQAVAWFRDELESKLREWNVIGAWERAGIMASSAAEGVAEFRKLLEDDPAFLWTAAAMAENHGRECPRDVRSVLEECVKAAHSVGHPLLPEEPCPMSVLQGYLDDARAAVERAGRRREGVASR
jgi:hypothetical protein